MSSTEKQDMGPSELPGIRIRILEGAVEKTDFYFRESFRIGRDRSCDIQISDPTVSRLHAEIWPEGGRWWVHDLQSGNGTFVDGKRVEQASLADNTTVELGKNGPIIHLKIEGNFQEKLTQSDQQSLTHYMKRYFSDSDDAVVGEHTMMIRHAFKKIQKSQKRKFARTIVVLICLIFAAGIYATLKHMEVRKQKLLAQDIFYAMKSLDLEFADFLKEARLSKDVRFQEKLQTYRARRKEMEESYDRFIKSLKIYENRISEEERAILRVGRVFGECEINMPTDFVKEVLKYVQKWKSTRRLKNDIRRAKKRDYVLDIAKNLLDYDLPPLFFYLALQESDFDLDACGPKTKYGIAKGMWQFIPSTAAYYGLRTGPLVKLRRPDPHDERHDFEKSTLAAARYLKDLYDTEAQASGLLVIASYNYGASRVNALIRKMPKNPRERNFWRFLAKHKDEIPKETYDYVFYIISAAVIGENPKVFGFDFDNPLAGIEKKLWG